MLDIIGGLYFPLWFAGGYQAYDSHSHLDYKFAV